jgi:hypothetical protein
MTGAETAGSWLGSAGRPEPNLSFSSLITAGTAISANTPATTRSTTTVPALLPRRGRPSGRVGERDAGRTGRDFEPAGRVAGAFLRPDRAAGRAGGAWLPAGW